LIVPNINLLPFKLYLIAIQKINKAGIIFHETDSKRWVWIPEYFTLHISKPSKQINRSPSLEYI